MKISTRFMLPALIFGASLLVQSVMGAVIQPLTGGDTAASSTISSGTRGIDQTVDGSDLSEPVADGNVLTVTHLVNGDTNGYWLSDNNPTNLTLTFDLGGEYNVTGIYHWVYARAGETNRGLRTFDIYVSSDGTNYSLGLAKGDLGDFAENTNTSSAAAAQTKTFASLNGVTHIELRNIDNFGGGETYYGLSEIRFEGTAVPEPSLACLGGLGALLLLRRRR